MRRSSKALPHRGPSLSRGAPGVWGTPIPSVLTPLAKALGRNAGDHKLGGKKRKKGHRKSHAPNTTVQSGHTGAQTQSTPEGARGQTLLVTDLLPRSRPGGETPAAVLG